MCYVPMAHVWRKNSISGGSFEERLHSSDGLLLVQFEFDGDNETHHVVLYLRKGFLEGPFCTLQHACSSGRKDAVQMKPSSTGGFKDSAGTHE